MKRVFAMVALLVGGILAADRIFAETFAEKEVAAGRHPGYVSIVAEADGTIRTNICGWADVERKKPMTARTMFWVASQTKGFAGALFAQLCAEGVMSPDDSCARYFPGLAKLKVAGKGVVSNPPTLRQLLSHTAGLPFKTPGMDEHGNEYRPMGFIADRLQEQIELHHEPGVTNVYGNLAIDLAAACMERATGKSFEALLQERFFGPLGMKDATFFPTDEQYARMATCYKFGNDGSLKKGNHFRLWLLKRDVRPRYAEAGGGLYMTAGDMFEFYWMLAHGGIGRNGRRVLAPAAIELLRTKQTPPHLSYQYSFGLGLSRNGRTLAHGGQLKTSSAADLDTGACRVWFVQLENREDSRFRESVWSRVEKK